MPKPVAVAPKDAGDWAPKGFKAQYRRVAAVPATPEQLIDLLTLIGYTATPEHVAGWTLRARVEAEIFAVNVHLRASDNILRAHPKPSWFPNAWKGPLTGGLNAFNSPTPIKVAGM